MIETHQLDHRLWIGEIHMVPLPGSNPFPSDEVIGAYTNCITSANNEEEYRAKVKLILGNEGFNVVQFEDIERLVDRASEAVTPADRDAIREIIEVIGDNCLDDDVATTEIHTYSEE